MCYIYHGEVLSTTERFFLSNTDRFFSTTDFTDLTDWTDLCPIWEQDKNPINPLERMEGDALLLYFRLGLIRASS